MSYDWFEDTLLENYPQKEFNYLMAPLIKCAAETKTKKKVVRQENIKKGSKSSDDVSCKDELLTFVLVERFEKGCKEFKEVMFSGTLFFD